MPSDQSPGNRLIREDIEEGMADNTSGAIEPPTKRRRVFLQTMGQQLREVGALRDGSGDIAQRFSGSTGGTSNIQSVNDSPTVDRPQGRQVQIQTPESDAVPGEDDQLPTGAILSASKVLWQPGEVLAIPATDGNDTFTFEDLIAWTRSYFDNWHPAYPFLHAPSILEYFEHVVHYGISGMTDCSEHQLTILRSIISISLADRRQSETAMRPVPPQLLFSSFNDAIQSIQCLLADESSIISLQAVVSVQLFLISMLRYSAASRLEGLAIRMAFHLGLHRCPVQSLGFPKKEVELRQRLFWSMYCIDRYICIRLGVPLGIRDAEIDVCFPTSERHGDGSYEPSNGDGRLDLFRFLARHAEIRGSISELRNKSVSYKQTEIDDAVVIGGELAKWWNEVEEYLDSNSSGLLPISRYHRVTLVVLRHESIIALNKHTLATSKKDSAHDAALQNCIGAARSIINTLHSYLEDHVDPDPSESHQAAINSGLLWPSFTWAVWMSVFLMIYAANEDQVPIDVAIKFADRGLEVLRHLILRGSVWPNSCTAAIRGLRMKLIDRRNRSKHTHVHSYRRSQSQVQGERVLCTPSASSPPQNNETNRFPTILNNSSNLEESNSVRAERPQPHRHHPMLHTRQDTGPTRDRTRSQDNFQPSSSHNIPEAALPSTSQAPALSGQNWMVSELTSNFGDAEGSGYAYRIWPQLGSELQIPIFEGSDLFYGLDMPFWPSNDQWMGISGNEPNN